MISEFIRTDIFLYIIAGINVVLLILYICNFIKLNKTNKNYKKFMKKLGNGNNIDEMLKKCIEISEKVSNENKEICEYCNKLEKELSDCIKKVGMVRYSAFKDTGSDLSFALAMLNDKNNGVLLNGIYSREMSNIYAKQIIDGKANSKISEEEEKALDIAINNQ